MLEVFIARRYALYRDARDLASKIPPDDYYRCSLLCPLHFARWKRFFKINISMTVGILETRTKYRVNRKKVVCNF